MENRIEVSIDEAASILKACTELKVKQCLDFAQDGEWQETTPERVLALIEPKAWLASGHHVAKFQWGGEYWVLALVEYIGGDFIPYLAMNKE